MTALRRAPRAPSVAFLCDACDREVVRRIEPQDGPAACPGCGAPFPARLDGAALRSLLLTRCLRCGLDRLYVQKDFNKKAGLWIFIAAAALSVPTWGVSLLVATAVDLALYHLLGDATLCYGCGAVHRGFRRNPAHGAFDIHVQEAVDRRARTA